MTGWGPTAPGAGHGLLRRLRPLPRAASALPGAAAAGRARTAAPAPGGGGGPLGARDAAGVRVGSRGAGAAGKQAAFHWIGSRFVGQPRPLRVWCERVQKELPELLAFVADPAAPAGNKAAERSMRPSAVRRTITGGMRSAAGGLTRTVPWTLIKTFAAQGKPLLDAWTALLRRPALASV